VSDLLPMYWIPQHGVHAIRANRSRVLRSNVQHRTPAVVDSFAHTCVDQKEESEHLEHLARLSHAAIGEFDPRGHMTFHDVPYSQSHRISD
jgi:hypothetical protein